MRTILDIPEDQAVRLDALVKKMGTSRAALIRRGIELLLEHEEKEANSRANAFGMWQPAPPVAPKAPAPQVAGEPEVISQHDVLELDVEAPAQVAEAATPEPVAAPEAPTTIGAAVDPVMPAAPAPQEAPLDAAAPSEDAEPSAKPAPAPPAGGDIWPASFFSTVKKTDAPEDAS